MKKIKAIDRSGLPDMTPRTVDFVIKSFKSKLCCKVNPVAIILKQVVCQDCFVRLKESYTSTWDLL